MRNIINILKIAIKYSAFIFAAVKVIEFAIKEFESIDLKNEVVEDTKKLK